MAQIKMAMMGQWWWFVWERIHLHEAAWVWSGMRPAERQRWVDEVVAEAQRRERDARPVKGLTDEESFAIWNALSAEQQRLWTRDLRRLVDRQWNEGLTEAERTEWRRAAQPSRAPVLETSGTPAPPTLRVVDVYASWPKLQPARFDRDHMGNFKWEGPQYGY